jgi:valyl-tRNA synthetase
MAEADLERYAREAEKTMAARQLADMQIALARQQQALAKLELIRFQLDNALIKAPFAGVVIEGDLKKNLGAPVRKGDLLVKLAQSTRTYLELEIDVEAEKKRLQGEVAKVEAEIAKVEKKLADTSFVQGAPAEVLENFKKRREEWQAKKVKLEAAIAAL